MSQAGLGERVQLPFVHIAGQGSAAPVAAACIHHLVAAQAARTPQAVAVADPWRALSYAELEERAGRVARRLRARGVGPESLVGICMDRSVGMVAAMLGVLRAGAAYVPLDPAYPADRIEYVLRDAGVRVVLTESALRGILPDTGAELLLADVDADPAGEGEPLPAAGVDVD
ncbi:MAG: AMP-binding protein, partial [Gemmatimonadetes bacterium]|nr:AMP-binding protein [Gemmatimonadota bacterium]